MILGLLLLAPRPARAQATIVSAQEIFARARRWRAAAVFDRVRNRMVAFGGFDVSTSVRHSDIEVCDLGVNPGWRPAYATGFAPPDDANTTGVYDPHGDRMLVFGSGPAGDRVWALNLAEPMAWTELHPTGTAPHLAFTGAVFDARRDRVVGYGGIVLDSTGQGSSVPDLWALDLSSPPAWTPIVAANPPGFSRYSQAAVYDSTGDRMLMFGGDHVDPIAGRFGLDETWQLDFGPAPAWAQILAAGGPPDAVDIATAYDDAQQRWILSGGFHGGTPTTIGTWDLTFPAGVPTWEAVTDAVPSPGDRQAAIGVYDPLAKRFLLSGGRGGFPPPDNWLWSRSLAGAVGPWRIEGIAGITPPVPPTDDSALPPVPLRAAGFDSARGAYRHAGLTPSLATFELLSEAPPRWRLRPDAGNAPLSTPADAPMGCVFDPTQNATSVFSADTLWTENDANPDTWTQVTIQGAKPSRRQSARVYLDAPQHRVIVFGGVDHVGADIHKDVWSLSLDGPPTWTMLSDSCPTAAVQSAPVVRDGRRNRLLLFGGDAAANGGSPTNDLWAFDLGVPAWTRLTPGDTPPAARYGHAAAYDSTGDRLLVVGGIDASQRGLDSDLAGVQFGPADAVGHWQRYEIAGQPLPTLFNPLLAEFPGEGVMREVGLDTLWTIRPGAPAGHVVVTTPTPQVWSAGHLAATAFDLTNRSAVGAAYTWQLRSTRNWPGFPLGGGTGVGAGATQRIFAPVTAPDTAAYGTNLLTMVVRDVSDAASSDSCTLVLADPGWVVQPLLTGPGDWIWKPGQLDSLPLELINPDPDAPQHALVVTWSSDRAWPGFPGSRNVTLSPFETLHFKVGITVPDTAADGVSTLHVTAAWQERPVVAGAVDVHLHDILTPTRIALVEASGEGEGGAPTLVWWAAGGAGTRAQVERRATDADAWSGIGEAVADAAGRIRFVDTSAPAGSRLAYRAGVPDRAGTQWSEETWLDVPAAAPRALAFAAGGRALVVRGGFDVGFTLPRPGPARLEAFDVRGRLVAARTLDAALAGHADVRLAAPGALRPGIYFLRLTQGGQRVQARALILAAH